MKNKLWLITFNFLLLASISTSCSNDNNSENSMEAEKGICNCLELDYDSISMIYKQEGKLFSGDCVKKNEKGEITQESSISQGLLSKNKVWASFGKSLYLIEEMEYSNNEKMNGWITEVGENVGSTWIATKNLKEYKNGKESYLWEIESSDPYMDVDFGNEGETYIRFKGDFNSKECLTPGYFEEEFFKKVDEKKVKNFHYYYKK